MIVELRLTADGEGPSGFSSSKNTSNLNYFENKQYALEVI